MTTPIYGFPYPALTAAPNVPLDVQALAVAVDTALAAEASTRAAADTALTRRLFGGRLAANVGVTTLADIAGCTVTFTTAAANTPVMITGVFDASTTAGNYVECVIAIDGTDQTQKAHATSGSVGGPDTATQVVNAVLAAAGSHTIKLRGVSSGGTSTMQAQSTGITVLVLGP